jgi:enoyl-CoA hydratase
LIIAADDAWFMDQTVGLGVNGHEYFVHALELGVRKAKEFLFTGMRMSAQDALACGMVNRVVPAEHLEAETLALAARIAGQPAFALKLTKMALNAAEDAMGRSATLKTSFALHQLAHSQNMQVHGCLVDPAGLGPALSGIDLQNISGKKSASRPLDT